MQKLKEFYNYKRFIKGPRLFLNKLPQHGDFLSPNLKLLPATAYFVLHVKSSFNNTIVTLTTSKGRVVLVKSCGGLGFKGKKKRTTKFAIESTLESVVSKIKEFGFSKGILCLNGFSKARYSILTCLKKYDVQLLGVRDITPNPYNGCRPRKLRRG